MGDKDKILLTFMRLERFLTKIAGKKIFEFEKPPGNKEQPATEVKAASPQVEKQKSTA